MTHNCLSYAQKAHWPTLIKAISKVESNHNPKKVSRSGKYVGILQMAPIAVDECNVIVGYKKYSYKDRWDPDKSAEMFRLIQSRHNKTDSLERAIRLWNGGPNYKKGKTEAYYRKVLRTYNNLM